jgi:hypothetical protein
MDSKGGEWLSKTPITGVDIMASMEARHKDPVGNNLNAATAAGIELARQSLLDSSKKQNNHWDWHSGPKMPPGISSSGFLNDDDMNDIGN